MSHVIKGVAGVLGNSLRHGSTKHAQTVELLERFCASIKQALETENLYVKALSEDHCGINRSVMRSLVKILLIT